MGHHYNPQKYLAGFSSNGKQIVCFDKSANCRSFTVAIEKAANINDFYNPEIEKYLAEKIEDPANSVLDKIINGTADMISLQDKSVLSRYMIVMMKRVPAGLQHIKEIVPGIAEDTKKEFFNIIDNVTVESNAEKADRLKDQVEEIFLKLVKNPKEIWLGNLPPDKTRDALLGLQQMDWKFLMSEKPVYLTCDNPFFFHKSLGLNNGEFSFPVSKNCCIWGNWDKTNGYKDVSSRGYKEINRRTAHNAVRFVYADKAHEWIKPFLKKGEWSISLLK